MTYASAVEIHAEKIMDVMRTMETPLTNGEIVDLLDKQYISTINYDVTSLTSLALNKLVADGKIERLAEKKGVMSRSGVVRKSWCYQVLANPAAAEERVEMNTIELNGVKYVPIAHYHDLADKYAAEAQRNHEVVQRTAGERAKVRQVSEQRGLNGFHTFTMVVDYTDKLIEVQPGDVIELHL